MAQIIEKVDVCVIGAGHAGCEAALAVRETGAGNGYFYRKRGKYCADALQSEYRRKLRKGILSGSWMRCGGEMGKNIDHTFIQSKDAQRIQRVLQCIRCGRRRTKRSTAGRNAADSGKYTEHLVIKQAEVCGSLYGMMWMQTRLPEKLVQRKKSVVCGRYGNGVRSQSGYSVYRNLLTRHAACAENRITYTGPNGLQAANHLTDSLKETGHCDAPFQDGNACENG